MIRSEILEFIHRRFPENNGNWLNGNCFWFALILKTRFNGGSIWYEPVVGHFLFKYDNYFYDWTGVYTDNVSRAFEFTKDYDENVYNRLIKYCVL